jgi:hypothetical protein
LSTTPAPTSLRCVPDPLHDTGSLCLHEVLWISRCHGRFTFPGTFSCLVSPLHSTHHHLTMFHANPQHLDIEKPGNLATEDVSPQPTCLPLPFRSRRAYAEVIIAIDWGHLCGPSFVNGSRMFFADPASPHFPLPLLYLFSFHFL